MAGTLVKRILVQITADDGTTEEKLDRIMVKGEELKKLRPDLTPKIDSAIVAAQMGVIRAELRGLSLKADEEAAKGGILSRFLTGKSGGGGLAGLLGNIPLIGEKIQSGLGGDANAAGGGGGPSPMGVLIGTAIASAPIWLPELNALVSGFAAAGAGAGAFTLLAIPAFRKVSTAVQQINADQQTYNRALTATARNTALAHLKQDYAALDPAQRSAVTGIQQLTGEWHKMSTAFEPEAFKVFTGVLQLANQLLPDLTPFAKTFADSFSGLLGQAGKFAGSSGFKDWLAQFQKLEGPSITAIGEGVGHLATSFGKLLTNMSAKDVVNGLNIAFSVLDGTILALTWVIKASMDTWDIMTGLFDTGVKVIRRGSHDVAAAFAAVRSAAADMGHGTAIWFDRQRHDVASLAATIGHYLGDVVTFFRRLPGEIGSALAALPGELYSAGQHAVSMFVQGLKSIPVIGPVVGWAQDIWDHLPHSPARKGPLSGAGSPDVAGRRIGLMLAAGMEQSTSVVAASNARLARAAGIGVHGTAAAGYGAGGGTPRLQLEWVGGSADQALITLLKQHIRVRGGNPSVLGA